MDTLLELAGACERSESKAPALLGLGCDGLSYSGLLDQARSMAASLAAMGVKRQDRVAIVLPNGPEIVVVFLAVTAVATSAPLNPAYSVEEFLFFLKNLPAKMVVTMADLAPNAVRAAEIAGVPVVMLTPAKGATAGAFTLNAPRGEERLVEWAKPDDVALILHTSGTTSKPKSVPLTHRNLVCAARFTAQSLELTPEDRCLVIVPLFHVHGLIGVVCSSLSAGGSVACMPGYYAAEFFKWIGDFQPTWFTAVPTMHQSILERARMVGGVPQPHRLRFIRSGTSPLAPAVMAEIERVFGVPLIEVYGMTEGTPIASNPLPPRRRKAGSAGIPAGTEVAVMDEAGRLLPAGSSGEIVIRGENVMSGYLDNAEANAKAFADSWFRTGDVGHLDEEGYVFLTGRIKEIIDRGGEKISPREIEEILLTHPAVEQAAAFPFPDPRMGQDVGAAIVTRNGTSVTARELREFVAARLAYFKVPAQIIFVQHIPKGPTGKIERLNLAPALGITGESRSDVRPPFVEPGSALELALAGIWEEVLDTGKVGLLDSFIDVGGDSLGSARVVARIRQMFQVDVALTDVMLSPTLKEQVELVELALSRKATRHSELSPPVSERAAGLEEEPLKPVSRTGLIPASFSQEQLWFLAEFQPEDLAYNLPQAFRITGALDIPALEQAVVALVNRHESLRTSFQAHEGRPQQLISSQAEFALPVVDLAKLSEAEQGAEIQKIANELFRSPFQLAREPLFRMTLVRRAADEHLLLVVIHHVVADGWSMGILRRDLSALYAACHSAEPARLPEIPVQYANYAVHQRRAAQSGTWDESLAYWRKQLADAPALEMPADHPRNNGRLHRAGVHDFTLPPELARQLAGFNRREGMTPFMTLLAAFNVLLARYAGQRDLVVGMPVANRPRVELENLIGFFVNMLPVRTDLSGDPGFREAAARTRRAALEAQQRQDLPFAAMVEHIKPDRVLGQQAIFQVALVVQNTPRHPLTFSGLEVTPSLVPAIAPRFDLEMQFWDRGDTWDAKLFYDADLFEPGTIERMVGHFRSLLASLLTEPDRSVWQAPMLSETEQHQLLVEWNNTTVDYPRDKCIHQLVEEQAKRAPAANALSFQDRRITYETLNAQAELLAGHLREMGVGPDVVVALVMTRCPESVIGMLAAWKAGGAYLPLDPANPKERLAHILSDVNPPVVLTESVLQPRLPSGNWRTVCLDEPLAQLSRKPVAQHCRPHHAAYVIFTSGSTGQPKGVVVEHRNLANLIAWHNRTYGLKPGDRTTQLASLAFDASVWEIWPALVAGATVCIVDDEVRADPSLLVKWLVQEQISVSFMPTPLAEAALTESWPANVSLRHLLTGGDQLKSRPPASCPFKLVNHYGPTEATVLATSAVVTPGNQTAGLPPIGRPVSNALIYILDHEMQPVPVGVAGELCIGGSGVARGYWGRPDLTAKNFVRNPFVSDPEARLYRTGDLCRWMADGNIEFLGRIDDQVKIRGHRIELGEIESVLGGHPEVASCAVVAADHLDEDKMLVAFVAFREQARLAVDSLRLWLAGKLPDSMIPSRFVAVPALPLNTNGKVNRKALEKMNGVELAAGTEYVAPRSKPEQELVEIWQAVLRRERVGIRDNFFDLGGHSLLATVMGSRIHRRLGKELSLRSVFEHPTIEQLAKYLAVAEGQQQNLHPIEKVDRQKPLLMSFGQQGMWLLQQTLPEPATYNQPVAWRLSGQVDREKVRRALQAIMERHEVLRTALAQPGEDLVQQIASADEVPLPWQEMDLRATPPGQQEEVLAERLLVEARRPFDLAQAPLWRAVWIELAADEHVLAFTFHHSLVDEWSSRLFFQELEQLYATDGQIELAGLPEQPVQYADYAMWQRQRLTGELLETQRNYWQEQLRDFPPALELPIDRERPLRPSGQGSVHDFQLAGPMVTRLCELARQEGTTLFTVMLAAFQVWLHRYTGQTDVVVGTPAANRERPEVQSLLGFFLNTLPIRTQLDSSLSFREIVRQVRQSLLGAFTHSGLPFEQMVELAVKERESGQQPLYQVMYVLLEERLSPLRLDEVQSRLVPTRTGTSKNDLMLSIQAASEAWDCQIEYATDLFTAETVARMARHLAELLRSITENPQEQISRLNLMPEEERHQVQVEWNRTERKYPQDKCVHQLFEEQVERTPDAVAVVFEGNSLTYRELNIRANQLAHHLRSLGVGPDILVGLCMERSLEMVVALLGILKAGGAHVPLDPTLPQQRLAFFMSDAACAVVVIQNSLLPLLKREPQTRETSPLLVVLDAMKFDLRPEAGKNPVPIAAPNHLAYVLYTSGSTGQPKGVEMPHRALVNLIHWQCSISAVKCAGRTLQFASLGFDVSFQEIFSTWMSGGTLVLVDDEIRTDPAALLAMINRERIDRIFLPFVMLEQLAETVGNQDTLPADLKEVSIAGEQLRIGSSIRHFFDRLPGCRVWNHYGPTEAHVVTSYEMTGPSSTWPDLPPIGRPLPNCQIYLLDAQLNPVPPGIVGELHIGGVCLSRGYRQRSDLTAQRFISHPFSSEPGARLYKTGDLARYLPDGNIEFIGRADHQVKIRGYRVELGEIEAVLGGHPAVSSCAVVARDHGDGDKILVAFVVNRLNEELSDTLLRQWLSEKLPDYMIPSCFVWLDQLPLTPNGKVDRKALPAPETSGGGKPGEKNQPVNLLELELVRIWRRLFKREEIGRQDNFFALGGHSLLAARLAAEIDKILGCKLPIATLFQSPTIESLARRLTDENWAPPWSSLVPLQPQGSKPPLFLVHGWGGDVYGFLELTKLLPPDQPCYGVQAVGLDGKLARHTTVEEMAAHYVKEIVSFQPTGSFYLAGYSMGGLIAFEIARQLHRCGRRVAFLALFDSSPVGPIPQILYGLSMASYIPGRCLSHFRRWWKLPRREQFNYLLGRWAALRFWMEKNLSKPPPVTAPPPQESQRPQVPGFFDYYHAVAFAYRLRPYPGSADVFRSDDSNETHPGWKWWYWRYFVRGGVSYHRVPGGHMQILFSPAHLPLLAKSLTAVLHRAQEKERAASSRNGPKNANPVS